MISGIFEWWFWPFIATGAIFSIILGIFAIAVWVCMLIDCIRRKFNNDSEKIVWVLVIILVHWIGAAIYYFTVKIYNPKGIAR